MKVLVTGGAGYIGSHTVVELVRSGMTPIIVDNFSNSKASVLPRLETITGQKIQYFDVDVANKAALDKVMGQVAPDAVIHFAGLKAVGESVEIPLAYYRNNLLSTISLCEVMAKYGVPNLIFSSSATVYGDPARTPIDESF